MKLIVSIEYVFIYPKLKEKNTIVNDTIRKHNQKYGDNHCREVNFKSNVKFLDKITNKTKNRTINRCNIIRTRIASNDKYDFKEVNKLTIVIEGSTNKNVI